ncbi:MAG TPA: TlpA disulfide reductase family protein [Candidatus Eisenbacteria bacterium]|nr:TlpA disulfide reductase family protein [Candidatus Eisenbacteria bacterium]
MTRRGRWVAGVGVLLLAQLAAFGVWQRVDRERKTAGLIVAAEPRSEPGHDLVIERPDGAVHPMAARSGGFQLVHFWATWCPPCRKEMPTLLELARRERERLDIWIITTDRDWKPVRAFFRGKIPANVVRDVSGGHRAYGVDDLPDSYLLDPSGRVVARFAGGQHWSSAAMRKTLDRLMLREPGS